jgi:hypothetical protein
MSHARPFIGAAAVIALLFIYWPLGVVAFLVCLLVGLAGWIGEDGSRPCPRCGQRVKNGVLECEHCGFDFNTIGVERTTAP